MAISVREHSFLYTSAMSQGKKTELKDPSHFFLLRCCIKYWLLQVMCGTHKESKEDHDWGLRQRQSSVWILTALFPLWKSNYEGDRYSIYILHLCVCVRVSMNPLQEHWPFRMWGNERSGLCKQHWLMTWLNHLWDVSDMTLSRCSTVMMAQLY